MARIDWNKVAEDYRNSSFNKERLYQYAKKAAEALQAREVPFDGYTDYDWHEPKKPQQDMGLMAELRTGFRRFFFPEPEPPDSRPPLVQRHTGYWILEACEEENHYGRQEKYTYLTKNGHFKEKKLEVFTGHAYIRKTMWVLLEDGELAICITKTQYGEYPPIESAWSIKEFGSSALIRYAHHDKEITDEWRIMLDEDILLLDHKKCKIQKHWANRSEYNTGDGECIYMGHHLITGKKGGGCSKKITALLKKYGL